MSSASSSASSSGSSAPSQDLILQYLNDFEPHRYPTGAALQLGPGHAGHRHSFADRTRRLWSPHSPRPPSGTALTASSGSLGSAVSRPTARVDRPHHIRGQQRYYQPPCRTSSLGHSAPPPPTPMVSHRSRVASPLAGVTEASPGVVSALSLQESAFWGGARGAGRRRGGGVGDVRTSGWAAVEQCSLGACDWVPLSSILRYYERPDAPNAFSARGPTRGSGADSSRVWSRI